MENILSFAYWFDLTPIRMSSAFEIGFFILFSLMIMAALVFRIMKKSRQDKFERVTLEKATALCAWLGVLGLGWLFMAFEEISIFGARFWFLLWLVLFVVLFVQIYRYRKFEVPKMRLAEQSKAEANKYLPRRR